VGVDGKIVGAIANFNDITGRRNAAAVEARLAALVRSTRAAVITWNSGGKVVDWNDGAARLLGYTADEIVGCDLSVLSMPGERRELGRSVTSTQPLYDRELVMRRKDGRPVHVAWTEAPVRDAKGNVVGSAGVGADLSERTHVERRVARLADEQRRQLGQQVHDSLGQQMTALGLLVGTLRSRLEAGGSVSDVTSNLERCVDDAKAQMRAIVNGLAPLEIDADGLQCALAKLAHGTALTHGIDCRLEYAHPVALRDNFTVNELYLIAREAVHNAVKHGRAGSIVIRVESSRGLFLQIRDDGVGIAAATGEGAWEGFGLRIMRYRARLIGATLKVERGANGGTVVTCTRRQHRSTRARLTAAPNPDSAGLTAKTTSESGRAGVNPHARRAPLLGS
jgi:PAS domain S-box-containing protein